MFNPMLPDRKAFAADPAGYSRAGWSWFAMLSAAHGHPVDPTAQPTSEDLKNPILWLTQAEAMSQAAFALINHEPAFENMPLELRGICDTQYCSVALMLVGYSLEVCLKAMILLRGGIEAYAESEPNYKHHQLRKLAGFIEDLDVKELAILDLLTHFVYWAGRYPDPGSKHIGKSEDIFELSESHQISAPDVLKLASRIMQHVQKIVSG